MIRRAAITLTSFAALCGLAGQAMGNRPAVLDVVGLPASGDERPRPIYMVIDDSRQPEARESTDTQAASGGRWVVYMNRNGGLYTPGVNDSRRNRSSIPKHSSVIQPWAVSEEGWQKVMSCMRGMFDRFNIEITDVDPGDIPHIESVVAGRASDVQINETGIAGVSPFSSTCATIDNSIVYTFAELLGNDYQFVCEVAAQEVAHSFGLDHQFLCEDPMSYLNNCAADKTFQDTNAQCGEYEPRACACDRQSQNSVQMLYSRVGPIDLVAPLVDIISPADGAVVGMGSFIVVEATDDVGLRMVELYIDGILTQTLTEAPFAFETSPTLAEGTYIIEIRAHDSKNVADRSIALTFSPSAPGNPNPYLDDPGSEVGPRPDKVVGGCSASGGASGGMSLLLVGLAALLARRRRYR